MSIRLRITILLLMTLALFFGFLDTIFPGYPYEFERLHIFLYNLCTGGTIILYFTQGSTKLNAITAAYLACAMGYAFFAFLEIYPPVLALSIPMIWIVEKIRTRAFSFFPFDFFTLKTPVSRKFHHASLLCLSIGIAIAGFVILNNEYFKWIELAKLKLNTFFLGFSFPLSLITFSLIFSYMENDSLLVNILKNISFWNINLGVIIFFILILAQMLEWQVVVTLILFFTVVFVVFIFIRLCRSMQQKFFLLSGMFFLLVTAITGIMYIIYESYPGYPDQYSALILSVHSFASLYGWNLCGLAVICRYNDFPIRLDSISTIALHWITVLVVAPFGRYYIPAGIISSVLFCLLLYMILFSQPSAPGTVRTTGNHENNRRA